MNPDRLGTAQWADPEEIGSKFAYKDGAFWLGRTVPEQEPIGVRDDRHVCLVAGTRSGKGASIIIPNLCLWLGSVFVVDPTGVNANFTAARRSRMGQAVHVLDPYRISKVDDEYRASFNPLDMLDPDSRGVVRDAQRIAASLVPPSPDSPEFALNGARRFISGVILHVLTWSRFDGRRNLVTVRDLVARGDINARDAIQEGGEQDVAEPFNLLWGAMNQNPACGGKIAEVGEEFERVSYNAPEQWAAVHDEAISATNFINNDDMRASLATSTFAIRDLKTAEKGASVYLTIPSRDKVEDFRWLRLMVSLAMTEMESTERKPACGHDVLIVLDEFAGLRKLDQVESGIAEIAQFGVKLFIVLQSLPQLKKVYGDNWETFLANCGTKIFFGLDDLFTRKYVSDLIGETEVMRAESSTNSGQTRSASVQTSTSEGTTIQHTEGRGTSDSYKRGILGLRDTAGLLRKLAGHAQASNSRESSSSTSKSTESGKTFGIDIGESTGMSVQQRFHKRPLISPDEAGKFFRRIEIDERSRLYPGLGIALLSSHDDPIMFRRCNYFQDPVFDGRYTPESGQQPAPCVEPVPFDTVVNAFGTWRDNLDGTVTDVTRQLMWMSGPVGMDWNGRAWTGSPREFTWIEAVRKFGCGRTVYRWDINSRGGKIKDIIDGADHYSPDYRFTPGSEVISHAGHTDWRLPTISELLALSFNCDLNIISGNIDLRKTGCSEDTIPDEHRLRELSHEARASVSSMFSSVFSGSVWSASRCSMPWLTVWQRLVGWREIRRVRNVTPLAWAMCLRDGWPRDTDGFHTKTASRYPVMLIRHIPRHDLLYHHDLFPEYGSTHWREQRVLRRRLGDAYPPP